MGEGGESGARDESDLARDARSRAESRPQRDGMFDRGRLDGAVPSRHPAPEVAPRRGGVMSSSEILFDEVSKFYGEVLGVNRVTLRIPTGITSLVGPNGSGKTTLMNLMAGLIHADRGTIDMRGISPRDPERL